ncbi:MAG TPA: ABC transporter substrate-binding protein [Gemmatimonadota bacterium]|nr:ABC transporter substrate-binding protein [Gemmatimonadota bacterium]
MRRRRVIRSEPAGVAARRAASWRLPARFDCWLPITLVLLSAAGCGAAGDRAADPAYARGSTVVMGVTDLDAVKPDNSDLDFLYLLPLAKRDERGDLQGHLARSWEHSSDHKEYTFHLRTGLQWDDGVPVTARDVKFTLDLLGHPDVAEYSGIESTVLNDSTIRIRAGSPAYIDDITYFPRHLLERLDPAAFWEWDFWRRPVGNGPYRFVRYVPDTMMEFEVNPRYYGPRPRIERVILKFVGAGAGLTELMAGNVDIVQANLQQLPRVASDRRFRVYSHAGAGARAIYWKTDHPLFADQLVRRALALALDRPALLLLLNLSAELPITDGVFTPQQFRRSEWTDPLPYDPDEARKLLEAAGWVDRDGDGVREKEGRPFRFTATVVQGAGFPELAVHLQEFFDRVGVRMEIVHRDAASMWELLRTGEFEAWMYVAQPGPSAQLRDFGRGNQTGYRNGEAFAIIDTIRLAADPAELDRLYRRLSAIYRNDLPFVRIIPWSRDWFVHRRIQGLSVPFRAEPDTYMETLWLASEEEDAREP